ncbi:MAG: hypothetical protein FWC87_12620 [Acidimicrobiaceae bacterium]|nr:hypothetical protein [Acidimicrobiaceae bacterium]
MIEAIAHQDDLWVEEAVSALGRRRKVLAPLGMLVGAFVMIFQGLKLLVSEWRLALVQIVPALWIWAAVADLKFHTLGGARFRLWHGILPVLFVLCVVVLSVAALYLNVVFAFAIARPGRPELHPAFREARRLFRPILLTGIVVGGGLGVAAFIVPDWGIGWFGLALSVMVGVMMVAYVAVPSRLVGLRATASRRDRWATTVLASVLAAAVSAPAYVLDRIGILLIGTPLLILGAFFLLGGALLQVGLTGAARAIKLSARLVGRTEGRPPP